MGLYNMTFYPLVDYGCCSVSISSNLNHSLPEIMGWLKKLIKFIKFNRKLLQLAGGCH